MRGHHGAAVFAACVAALAPPPQHRVSSRRARLAPLRASGAIERVWPEASRALDLLREAADDDDVEPGATYVYEPEGDPWGLVHLVGGAALGTFPQVAYVRRRRSLGETSPFSRRARRRRDPSTEIASGGRAGRCLQLGATPSFLRRRRTDVVSQVQIALRARRADDGSRRRRDGLRFNS